MLPGRAVGTRQPGVDAALSRHLRRASERLRDLPAIHSGRMARCANPSHDGIHPTGGVCSCGRKCAARTIGPKPSQSSRATSSCKKKLVYLNQDSHASAPAVPSQSQARPRPLQTSNPIPQAQSPTRISAAQNSTLQKA